MGLLRQLAKLVALLTLRAAFIRYARTPTATSETEQQKVSTGARRHWVVGFLFLASAALVSIYAVQYQAVEHPTPPPSRDGALILLMGGAGGDEVPVQMHVDLFGASTSTPTGRVRLFFDEESTFFSSAEWMLVASGNVRFSRGNAEGGRITSLSRSIIGVDEGSATAYRGAATESVEFDIEFDDPIGASGGGRSYVQLPLFGDANTLVQGSPREVELLASIDGGEEEVWASPGQFTLAINAGPLEPFVRLVRVDPPLAPASESMLHWMAGAALQPRWETVSSLAEEQARNRSLTAGIMFGFAASLAVAGLQFLFGPTGRQQ